MKKSTAILIIPMVMFFLPFIIFPIAIICDWEGIFDMLPWLMPVWFILMFAGFGIYAYIQSKEATSIFKKITPVEQKNAAPNETICPHCGEFIGFGDRNYCPNCGKKIDDRLL